MPAAADLTSVEAPFELPAISQWQLRLFARYVRLYLRRHFFRLHLHVSGTLELAANRPLLICLNHPSWWDPLLAVYLSQRFFAGRRQYAPIAAKGLEKYKFFERLGFFGINPQTRAGASRFLQIGRAVMARADDVLWVTAQGHFTDVRERPVALQSGLGHLAHRAPSPFCFLPIAIEYAFWEESRPEAFVFLGAAESIENGRVRSAAEWTAHFSKNLESAQDTLARLVRARDPHAFKPLLQGVAGVGGVYDLWRGAKSWARGKRFEAHHGRHTT